MGAHSYFDWYQFSDKEKIRDAWECRQDDDAWSSGNDSYAGNATTFGEGLVFHDKVFDTITEAENWILDHHQKWSSALVVYYRIPLPLTEAQKRKAEKASEENLNLIKEKKLWLAGQIDKFYARKSKHVGCKSCGSKISVKFMKEMQDRLPVHLKAYPGCPVCQVSWIKPSQLARLEAFDRKITAAGLAFNEAKRPKLSSELGAVVGGWAAS
jgi:DNA-directed RNA polymerase subunit RPC12/RpoP